MHPRRPYFSRFSLLFDFSSNSGPGCALIYRKRAFEQVRDGDEAREAGLRPGTGESAFDELERAYLAHKERLLTFAAALLGDKALAEDVVHDVFSALAREPERIGRSTNLPGYLTVCARNRAISLLRKRKGRPVVSQRRPEDMASGLPEPSERVSQVEENGALLRRLGALPEDLREVLALRIWGEMGFREIAKVQGVAKSMAHKRYVRALERLRRAFTGGLGDE
jgi:RNA polymerase sigma-70 factor (ECF subfamily)